MKINFLFWNINRRPLQRLVAELAHEHAVDVLILCECNEHPDAIAAELNAKQHAYVFPFSPAPKLVVFTRFPKSWTRPVFDDPNGHVSIRRMVVERRTDFLLVVAHLQSKLHWSDRDQALACTKLIGHINREEDRAGHQRTILVGDLNMNPFEDGVVAAHGLHGVMTMSLAEAATREVDASHFRLFYNPMWACFGDRTAGPPGTYYYRDAKPVMYFWNVFDQVMIRPSLMRGLTDLRILTSVGTLNLLSPGGYPDVTVGSDHLPVLFSVEL